MLPRVFRVKISAMQRTLNAQQLGDFNYEGFAATQVDHYQQLFARNQIAICSSVLDIGGGSGYFAASLKEKVGGQVALIDSDLLAVSRAREAGLCATHGDALAIVPNGEAVVCFNLILHHLVAETEESTRNLQLLALKRWNKSSAYVFVHEYIYESLVGDAAGRLIFEITKSSLLSRLSGAVGKFIPTLRANTSGVGVRFRSASRWRALFNEAGFSVVDEMPGSQEKVSLARRALFIRSIHRRSFLLKTGIP
jgi:hypothetical protein